MATGDGGAGLERAVTAGVLQAPRHRLQFVPSLEASGTSTAVAASNAFVELMPTASDGALRWDIEIELGAGATLRLRRG